MKNTLTSDKKSNFILLPWVKNNNLYLFYTMLFILMATIIFSGFLYNGKSFVWQNDGLKQHLPALTYYGVIIREFFKNVFIHHTFQLPMWDLRIGYGSDIITTLHYYVIGDPFSLLSAFVPASKTEYLYAALILLRLYLAGFTFSMYCKKMNRDKLATLCGSMIYVFSGYIMFAGAKHPYFINPMIFLPLLLIGIEKVYKKEKPYLFILTTAISALSNFYFFYMLSILIFIYAILRYIIIFQKFQLQNMLAWFLKFCGYFLIGSSIAMIIFLPNAIFLFSSSRFSADVGVPSLYDMNYYYSFVVGFISSKQAGVYTKTGYSAIAAVAVIILFAKKRKYPGLKIAFLLTTLFCMFPVFGHIFNGFSTVKNRWIFGYSMLIAFITVTMIPYFFTLKRSEKIKTFLGTIIYCYLFHYCMSQNKYSNVNVVLIPLAIVIILAAIAIIGGKLKINNRFFKLLLLGVTCFGICINTYYFYYISTGKSYMDCCKDRSSTYALLTQTPSSMLDTIKDNTIYRYDRDEGNGELVNSALTQNRNSVGYYFSVADGNIGNFYEEQDINTSKDFYYKTLDNRSILELLASVKYFMISENDTRKLPYSYDNVVINNKNCQIYTSNNYLPLGYTYSHAISRKDYDSLSVTQKQWALLQGVVLEKDIKLKKAKLSFTDKRIPYTIEKSKGATLENNSIKTTRRNASITLKFNGFSDSETYILLKNVDASNAKNSTQFRINVKGDYETKYFDLLTPEDNLYCGRNSFLCNLGYNKDACSTVTLTFKRPGEYKFDDLSIICQPMSGVSTAAQELKEDTLDNLKITTNQISGIIQLDKEKVLLLSIPYSTGWTAYVDGKKQEVLKANTMYVGLDLEPGTHKIKLTYETPSIRIGILISLFGMASLLGVVLYYEKGFGCQLQQITSSRSKPCCDK